MVFYRMIWNSHDIYGMLKPINEAAARNPDSLERGMSMAIYVCPICDQKMMTKHFCTNCRSYIKEPFVREMTYYLNERHPEHESDCTYHQGGDEQRYRPQPAPHRAPVPNQPSLSSHANLNGEDNKQSASIPNHPRRNTQNQSVNMENMEQYVKAMKDIGLNGIKGASELLKEYNSNATQSRQSFETRQEEKKQGPKTLSTITIVILFIIFVNVFTGIIVPFLRYIMTSVF